MTESSATDPAAPSVQEDHTQVIALMNSADMQKRLQDARVRRAKILEARESGLAEPSDLRGSDVRLPVSLLVSPSSPDEPHLTHPAITTQEQPVSANYHRRSQAYSLVIGLVSGLALGAGVMWYSGFRFPGISVAPDDAGTLVQEEHLAIDADDKEVETIATDHFGVDPVPPKQTSLAESDLLDRSLDPPLADQSPVKPDFGAFQAPQGSDRVTVRTASSTVPADTDQPPSGLRPNPASQEQIPTITRESSPVPHQKTNPNLGTAQATDQPPLMPIQPLVPRQSARLIGAASNPATVLAGVPLQVALHLSPDLSQEELDGAIATITTAGVELASTSIASFGVLQSEVRFFHQADALSATRMAQEIRIKVRDYSTYRPVPIAGTLEIWLAQGS